MKKPSLLPVCLALFFFSAKAQNPTPEKEKKHSIGITLSPVAAAVWWWPEYENMISSDAQPNSSSYLRYRTNPIAGWPCGLRYSYHALSWLGIETGVNYSAETNHISRIDYYEDQLRLWKELNYREDFIQVPLSLVLYPYSKKGYDETKFRFFFKLGASFDFIVSDRSVANVHYYRDNHFSYPTPDFYKKETAGSDKNKIRFNRICPLFAFGQTVNVSKHLALTYNFINLQWSAVYRKKNTMEDIRNIRFGLMNMGMSYRF